MIMSKLSWRSWGCGSSRSKKKCVASFPNLDTAPDTGQLGLEGELKKKVEPHFPLLKQEFEHYSLVR